MNVLIIVELAFVLQLAHGNVYTNPSALSGLFTAEYLFGEELACSVFAKEIMIAYYLRLMQPVFDEVRNAKDTLNVSEVVNERLITNPVHIFSLIRRLEMFEEQVLSTILINYGAYDIEQNRLLDILYGNLVNVIWPGKEDLDGSGLSLARVQFTHQIPAIDLAQGYFTPINLKTYAALTVDECMEIAHQRVEGYNPSNIDGSSEFALAIEWAEAALELAEMDDPDYKDIPKINTFLMETKAEHDKEFQPMNDENGFSPFPNENFFIQKFSDFNETISSRKLRFKEHREFNQRYTSEGVQYDEQLRSFHKLCRGESVVEI